MTFKLMLSGLVEIEGGGLPLKILFAPNHLSPCLLKEGN